MITGSPIASATWWQAQIDRSPGRGVGDGPGHVKELSHLLGETQFVIPFGRLPDAIGELVDAQAFEWELASINAAGVSLNRGDNEPDIGAVAVPILLRNGRMYLSMSVFGMLSRFDDRLVDEAKELLKSAADQLRSS